MPLQTIVATSNPRHQTLSVKMQGENKTQTPVPGTFRLVHQSPGTKLLKFAGKRSALLTTSVYSQIFDRLKNVLGSFCGSVVVTSTPNNKATTTANAIGMAGVMKRSGSKVYGQDYAITSKIFGTFIIGVKQLTILVDHMLSNVDDGINKTLGSAVQERVRAIMAVGSKSMLNNFAVERRANLKNLPILDGPTKRTNLNAKKLVRTDRSMRKFYQWYQTVPYFTFEQYTKIAQLLTPFDLNRIGNIKGQENRQDPAKKVRPKVIQNRINDLLAIKAKLAGTFTAGQVAHIFNMGARETGYVVALMWAWSEDLTTDDLSFSLKKIKYPYRSAVFGLRINPFTFSDATIKELQAMPDYSVIEILDEDQVSRLTKALVSELVSEHAPKLRFIFVSLLDASLESPVKVHTGLVNGRISQNAGTLPAHKQALVDQVVQANPVIPALPPAVPKRVGRKHGILRTKLVNLKPGVADEYTFPGTNKQFNQRIANMRLVLNKRFISHEVRPHNYKLFIGQPGDRSMGHQAYLKYVSGLKTLTHPHARATN